jgi:hypothetical protein
LFFLNFGIVPQSFGEFSKIFRFLLFSVYVPKFQEPFKSFGEFSKTFPEIWRILQNSWIVLVNAPKLFLTLIFFFFWKVTYVSILALFLRVLAISPLYFKTMWRITPLMPPLQYDLRDPAAQDNSTTLSDNSTIEKNKNNFHICGCVSSKQKELGLQLKSVP